MVSRLLQHLGDIPAPWILAVVGALVFSEAAVFVGFVLPGETAVLLGGFLASTGHLPVAALVVVVVLCAIIGDSVGYEVGRVFGPKVLAWPLLRKHGHRIDGARRFLDGRGGSAVFLGRFTAFLRAVIPGLAGLSGMRYRRFLAFNAAGGLAWGVGVVLLGYFAGHSYAKVEQWLGNVGAVVVALVVIVGIIVWRRSRRRRREEPTD